MKELEFAQIIKNIGGTAYRVGGSIRNQLLGIPVNDNDYCVIGVIQELFTAAFPDAVQVGQSFPVFLLEINGQKCEVAFARREIKTAAGHKGFEVVFSSDITIKEDLARRDFTMNAIAYDIITQEIIDPFNGREDIHNNIIRATSEAFKEDPLRVYRAARFAAQLGFDVDSDTIEIFKDSSLQEDMNSLSVERIFVELEKALKSPHPERFFEVLKEGMCLPIHFKEIHDLIDVPQPIAHHPEGCAYTHTMQVLSEMSKQTDIVERRFTALAHDLGKARTPEWLLPRHHGHEEAGLEPLNELCNRLRLPTKWRSAAHFGVVNHGRFHRVHEMRDVKIVDILDGAKRSPLGIEGLAQLGMADARGRNGLHKTHTNYEPFIRWGQLISTVKGKKELEGRAAWDDKRKRQASLIKQDKGAIQC